MISTTPFGSFLILGFMANQVTLNGGESGLDHLETMSYPSFASDRVPPISFLDKCGTERVAEEVEVNRRERGISVWTGHVSGRTWSKANTERRECREPTRTHNVVSIRGLPRSFSTASSKSAALSLIKYASARSCCLRNRIDFVLPVLKDCFSSSRIYGERLNTTQFFHIHSSENKRARTVRTRGICSTGVGV